MWPRGRELLRKRSFPQSRRRTKISNIERERVQIKATSIKRASQVPDLVPVSVKKIKTEPVDLT